MNNFIFFMLLCGYGSLMAVWFFKKHKIQKSLPLALVTHNPVQMIMNIYVISFICIKYNLEPFTFVNFLVALTLYFPALIWEISRKIRAPKDETEYVTYSGLFGYKKAVRFVWILTVIDIITNIILLVKLNFISILLLVVNICWFTERCITFNKNPEKFKIVDKVERYTYIQESIMLITIPIYLLISNI